jgi:glycosyltransferase involved in cell wall biosynthesis
VRIIILADFKVTAGSSFWIREELEQLGYTTELLGIQDYDPKDDTTRIGKIKTWYKYFKLASKGLRLSGKDDVLISDNFVIGAITAFLGKLRGRNRKVIGLNMIAHDKGIVNRLFRKIVYNRAFRNPGFWFSVNDRQLVDLYAKEFQFPAERVFVLQDPFFKNDEQAGFSGEGSYVFTGGDAYRDWEGVISCARELPDIRFTGVARKKYFPAHAELPSNLTMYFDTSQDEFYGLLKNSRLVFLPLNSKAPCGLIVMMRAALLSKPVVISDTPSTQNYIRDQVSGRLLPLNDREKMKEVVSSLYGNTELQQQYAGALKSFILEHFSTGSAMRKIETIIKKQ